jgi:hypothetical protein
MITNDPIFILNKRSDEKYVIKHQQGHVEVRDKNNLQVRKHNLNLEVLDLIKKRYGTDIIII